jgi:hypothetical protein
MVKKESDGKVKKVPKNTVGVQGCKFCYEMLQTHNFPQDSFDNLVLLPNRTALYK